MYQGKYQSIGLITLIYEPEVRKDLPTSGTNSSGKVYDNSFYKKIAENRAWYIKNIKGEDALKAVYEQALSMGADALVNLNITTEIINNGGMLYDGIKISGFAIKRE